jgi:hypothetical protein
MPDFMTAVPTIMRRTFLEVSGEGAGVRGDGERDSGARKGESKLEGAARTAGESALRARASPVRREKLRAAAAGAAETGMPGRAFVRAEAASTRDGNDDGLTASALGTATDTATARGLRLAGETAAWSAGAAADGKGDKDDGDNGEDINGNDVEKLEERPAVPTEGTEDMARAPTLRTCAIAPAGKEAEMRQNAARNLTACILS